MTIANVAWRRSDRDRQVHAFVLTQIAEANRTYLEALCRHSAPPDAVEPAVHRPGENTCLHCLVILGDPGRPGAPLP